MLMQDGFRRLTIAVLLVPLLMAGAKLALAQGSAGGSIGNDDKSLSGSRPEPRSVEPERPSRRSKPEPAEEPRRSSRERSGGGNFDGAWIVSSIGTTCQGSSTNAVVVTSGRVIGQGISGHVNPNGSTSAVSSSNGVISTSVGHLSGRTGSGSFRQSNGCIGRWSAVKQ